MNRFYYETLPRGYAAYDQIRGDEAIATFREREHAEAFVEKMNEVLPLRNSA